MVGSVESTHDLRFRKWNADGMLHEAPILDWQDVTTVLEDPSDPQPTGAKCVPPPDASRDGP